MAEAQGALEYLIVVSVSLAVLATVAMLATNYFSTGKSDYAYSACKEAASRCYMAISGNPSEPCLFCNNACNYTDGTEIFANAVTCCKQGKLSDIYAGSPGCTAPVVPVCPNRVKEGTEQCDNGVVCNCPSPCPSSCAPDCTCQHLPSACSFTETKTFAFGDYIYSLAVGNVDQDPADEIVAGIRESGVYKLVMYDYNGADWPRTIIKNTPAPVNSIAIGDIDNDLANEVVIGMDATLYEVRSYKYSPGIWPETNISHLPTDVAAVAVGNVDNDEYNDVIVGMYAGFSKSLRMYENMSGKWVETNISDSSTTIWSISTGDVDQDTKNEVVIGAISTSDSELRMYKNVSGTWRETRIADFSLSVFAVSVGDANNDGYIDIVVGGAMTEGTSGDIGKLKIYTNKSGGWTAQNIGNDWDTIQVRVTGIGDVDNDGMNEIVAGGDPAGGSEQKDNRMYENVSGTWVKKNILFVDALAEGIGIGDVNNDGKNEVVIALEKGLFTGIPPFRVGIYTCA